MIQHLLFSFSTSLSDDLLVDRLVCVTAARTSLVQ